ncbi:MAG TPA: lysoplasmalogenase [Anaerolineae bacterium]|nr:lysoplasmalogenase [Anaerolineae bacterium]
MSTSQQVTKRLGGVSTRVLALVGLIAAAIYIIALWANWPSVELIAKGIPLLCLIVWLFRLPRDGFANLIMAGLLVSLIADLVMQWDKSLFVPALFIFLVAQLVYLAAFVSVSRHGRWAWLIPFVVWGLIVFLILNPYLGDQQLPIVVYLVALVILPWRAAAMLRSHGQLETFELGALVGTLAFALGDTLLLLNHFIWHDTLTMFSVQESAPFIGTLVIILYWLGQWALALAAGWETKDRARVHVADQH